jgi:hypothetical protein
MRDFWGTFTWLVYFPESYSQASCSDRPSCFEKKLAAFFSAPMSISGGFNHSSSPHYNHC